VNIKFGPITDENLASALRHHGAEDIDIARMADELTQRRARDLTALESELLAEMRRDVIDMDRVYYAPHIAALDKLTKGPR
jgi:hypothetical protein